MAAAAVCAAVLSLVVVVLTVASATTAVADPSKPVWPTNFQTPFGLYVAFPPVKNATAEFYYKYDSEAQVQLLDYQQHCIPLVHWDAVGHPCKVCASYATGIPPHTCLHVFLGMYNHINTHIYVCE